MTKKLQLFLYIFIFFSIVVNASESRKVSLQLSWFDQFQFAGYYVAKEKGFYKDIGLDIEIKPFKFGLDIPKDVSEQKIDFAVGREILLLQRADDRKIVILYALFQSSPLVLLSTKQSGIDKVGDFTNKKVMTTIEDAAEVSIKAMITTNDVSVRDLTFLKHTHNINDLIDKKTDVISAYLSKSPFELQQKGIAYNIFAPKDYGFDMYSDFLYTSEELLFKDEELVKKFKEASLRGWEYAFSHIDEAVDIILKKYNQQNLTKEALTFEANELKKLAYENIDNLGDIKEEKVKRIFDLYRILGFLDKKIDFDKLIYDERQRKVFLTKKEKEYLKNKKEVTLCVDPYWQPISSFDKDGKYVGINADITKLLQNELSIPIKILKTSSWYESLEFAKQRKCDIVSLAAKTKSRSKYLSFTKSIFELSTVLATRLNEPFIEDFKILSVKKVGIPKGYAKAEILKEKYPKMKIVEVKSVEDGLQKVVDGELYGFIGNLQTLGYQFQHHFTGQLKISGKLSEKLELRVGVRNDDEVLFEVFSKLVQKISKEQVKEILAKNTSVKYEQEIDYKVVWYILSVVALLFFIFIYRQSILNKANKSLNYRVQEKTKELKELNESLEAKVNIRTQELRKTSEKLEEMAFRDNLTQIYNRYHLFKVFEEITYKKDGSLSLLMIDIDFFKAINDTHGHLIGDDILKYIVKNIQNILRKDDIFVRYGGEEFIVILPSANKEESLKVSKKIREYIEKNPYIQDGLNISLSVSIGVSQYKKDEHLEKLIQRADKALYKAKENGRNQVQVYVI